MRINNQMFTKLFKFFSSFNSISLESVLVSDEMFWNFYFKKNSMYNFFNYLKVYSSFSETNPIKQNAIFKFVYYIITDDR